MSDLRAYYRRRAHEYDRVYAKPERAPDITAMHTLIGDALRCRHVLELAAGTGFWTARYAPAAASAHVTDVSEEPLAIARARADWPGHVTFGLADAFAAADAHAPHPVDAVFAGFLWSHCSRGAAAEHGIDALVDALHHHVQGGGIAVLADNRFVAGSNQPITRTDHHGDTYQTRRLDDGSSWEVLKNFPDSAELHRRLSRRFGSVAVTELRYFWFAVASV